jgi:hypothetical protein
MGAAVIAIHALPRGLTERKALDSAEALLR